MSILEKVLRAGEGRMVRRLKAIAEAINCFVDNVQPKIALERARRGLARDVRPSSTQLEAVFKAAEASD